jgi:hypothetical protein
MTHDTGPSSRLRAAYDAADPEMEASGFLRERTLRSLRDRGLVGAGARGGRWRTLAIAAASAAAGLVIGLYAPQQSLGDRGMAAAPSRVDGTVEAALLEVQRTGTAHAHALGRMIATLDRIDASTLAGAQDVFLAARQAHEEYAAVLLAGRVAAPAAGPASHDRQPLIWF